MSPTATFADGPRVESRWSYPGGTHWSQVDTVYGPGDEVLGTVTTTFDGERVTRVAEPTDGPAQTDVWDRDGPVATVQNVAAPVLAIPFLLDLTAAAIGAVIVGKAIDDTINRPGAGGTFGGSEMARPPGEKPGKGHNNPPEPVDDDPSDEEAGKKPRRQGKGSHETEPVPTDDRKFQTRKSGQIGKESSKNIPGWAKESGVRPYVDETPDDAATRVMDQKKGKGNWKRGPGSEFSKIKKFFSKAFEDPRE